MDEKCGNELSFIGVTFKCSESPRHGGSHSVSDETADGRLVDLYWD